MELVAGMKWNGWPASLGITGRLGLEYAHQAQEHLLTAFDSRKAKHLKEDEKLKEELYRQIGQLKVELDWLKKKSGM